MYGCGRSYGTGVRLKAMKEGLARILWTTARARVRMNDLLARSLAVNKFFMGAQGF